MLIDDREERSLDMRAWIKSVTAVLMTGVLMLSACGCSGKDNEDVSGGGQGESTEAPGMAFEGRNMEISGIEGDISYYCVRGDKLYIMTSTDDGAYQIYCCGLDGSNAYCVAKDINEAYMGAFSANDAGELLYLAVNTVGDNKLYGLVKLDSQGNEIIRYDVSRNIGNIQAVGDTDVITENAENLEIVGLAGVLLRHDGSVVLGSGENVYLYDENLSNEKKVKTPANVLTDIALVKNGDIVCVTDEVGSPEINVNTYILNMESLTWSDALNIRIGEAGGRDVVMDGEEYDFYYESRAGINGYTVATGESEVLINEFKSYMGTDDMEGIQAGAGGSFIGVSKEYGEQGFYIRLVAWNEAAPDADKDKTIITLGVPTSVFRASSEVARFNRNHSDCKIEVVELLDMDEDRLLADMMAGKMPDIVNLDFFPMSVKQCAAKGLIEELTPYYEKDEELRVEDMLPEVYEAEMEAGGLYYVAPSFGLTTLMGRTEDVGAGEGWTVSDLKAMMDKKGEKAELFDMKDIRMYYLDMFLCNSISDYVDWDKGVCNFDSDDFRYLLELSYSQGTKKEQEMTDAEIMENVDTQYSRFRDGEYLLIDEDEVSLHMLQFEREAIGVPLNYIGYPNKEGEGSYFDYGEMYAISSRSENKELAWEFLRGLLSEEHQKKEAEANDSVMPVMKDCFDKRMKAMTTTKTYIDEFGETVEPEEEYDFSWGDYSTKIGVPKEEDVKLYMDILHRTKHAKMYDGTVLGIVYEEAQDYFSDRKKLDKTIDVIQKRVTTYINEQKQ